MSIDNVTKIKNSFLVLLKETPYSSISIQKITDTAKVSRRTFYQYYENKQQLLEEMIGDFLEWSLRPFEKNVQDQPFSSKIEQFIYTIIENLDHVEALFQEDAPNVLVSVIDKVLTSQIQKDRSGFFIKRLSTPYAQRYYIETISQNCATSIRYVLENKQLSKKNLMEGLCEACDTISYFYKTH